MTAPYQSTTPRQDNEEDLIFLPRANLCAHLNLEYESGLREGLRYGMLYGAIGMAIFAILILVCIWVGGKP